MKTLILALLCTLTASLHATETKTLTVNLGDNNNHYSSSIALAEGDRAELQELYYGGDWVEITINGITINQATYRTSTNPAPPVRELGKIVVAGPATIRLFSPGNSYATSDTEDRWSTGFRNSVTETTKTMADEFAQTAQDMAAKKTAQALASTATSKQALLSQALTDYYTRQGIGAGYVNGAAASGVYLPSSASQNTTTAGEFGPPVVVNQSFKTGVSKQHLAQTAQTIQREIIRAVQTKVAAGGDYRREVQC